MKNKSSALKEKDKKQLEQKWELRYTQFFKLNPKISFEDNSVLWLEWVEKKAICKTQEAERKEYLRGYKILKEQEKQIEELQSKIKELRDLKQILTSENNLLKEELFKFKNKIKELEIKLQEKYNVGIEVTAKAKAEGKSETIKKVEGIIYKAGKRTIVKGKWHLDYKSYQRICEQLKRLLE